MRILFILLLLPFFGKTQVYPSPIKSPAAWEFGKFDSAFIAPYGDTARKKLVTRVGAIKFHTDKKPYYWDSLKWVAFDAGAIPTVSNGLVQVDSIRATDTLEVTIYATDSTPAIWRISGVDYSFNRDSSFAITAATTGFFRKDIIVGNASGSYQLIQGVEATTTAVQPATPANTVLITVVDVTGASVVPPAPDLSGFAQLNADNTYTGLNDFYGETNFRWITNFYSSAFRFKNQANSNTSTITWPTDANYLWAFPNQTGRLASIRDTSTLLGSRFRLDSFINAGTTNIGNTNLRLTGNRSLSGGDLYDLKFDSIPNLVIKSSQADNSNILLFKDVNDVDILEINGGGINSDNSIKGIGDMNIGTTSASQLSVITNNTTRLRVDDNGNVIIGNGSITSKLHVFHTDSNALRIEAPLSNSEVFGDSSLVIDVNGNVKKAVKGGGGGSYTAGYGILISGSEIKSDSTKNASVDYVNYKDDIQQGFIDLRKLESDSSASDGYTRRDRLQQQLDSAAAAQIAAFARLAAVNIFTTRNTFNGSLKLNPDSIAVSTDNQWLLTIDLATGDVRRINRIAAFVPNPDTTITTNYTLTQRDLGRAIYCTNTSLITITIPTGLTTGITLPQDRRYNIGVYQEGTGNGLVQFAGSGVTLQSTEGATKTRVANSYAEIKFKSDTVVKLVGDII